MSKISGQNVFQYSFKRKDKMKTMSTKVKLGKKIEMKIDRALLFQRLIVVANNSNTLKPDEVFSYELCSYSSAIFESPILLRKTDKLKIVEPIVKFASLVPLGNDECAMIRNTSVKYVLNRGSLLYRNIGKWKENYSYLDIENYSYLDIENYSYLDIENYSYLDIANACCISEV